MRIKSRFVFPLAFELEDAFYARINMPMPQKKIRDTLRVIEVYKDTEEYVTVIEALQEFGVTCKPDETIEFSKSEMESAPLLQMIPKHHRGGYPQPENPVDGKDYLRVSFDMSTGCPTCTNGHLQNNPLHLRSNTKLGTADITGVWWLNEFIVSQRAKDIIEKAGLTGCEFWPLIKHKTGEYFEDIYQLKITAELPPMAEQTTFYKNNLFFGGAVCPNCDGEQVLKSLAYYHADVLEDLPDFALSNEWNGARSNRWRLPFMSQKAYRLFQKEKLKGIWWIPAIVLP